MTHLHFLSPKEILQRQSLKLNPLSIGLPFSFLLASRMRRPLAHTRGDKKIGSEDKKVAWVDNFFLAYFRATKKGFLCREKLKKIILSKKEEA